MTRPDETRPPRHAGLDVRGRALVLTVAASVCAIAYACGTSTPDVDASTELDAPWVGLDAGPEDDAGEGCPSRTFVGDYLVSDAASQAALSGYTEVTGDLAVDQVASLAGAECLTSIGGDLLIANTAALTDLDELSRLTSIGGSITLGYTGFHTSTKMGPQPNQTLTSLAGLRHLRSVPGALTIAGCEALTDLNGLGRIESVGGDLVLYQNAALTDLDGVGITSIGGDLALVYTALTNIDALGGVRSIGGSVMVIYNGALSSLEGLASVTRVAGTELVVGGCAGYCRTEGCVCGGPAGLVIYENDALRSLDGLRRVSSVAGVLAIEGNRLLATLDGLGALTSLGGDVSVVRNPSIPTCEVTALLERLRALGWSGESFFDGTCM